MMCEFNKIKNTTIKKYANTDDEIRKIGILHDKYLLPILELQSNIEEWVMEFQSLILVYSFYLDYYIDENKESYKTISDSVLNDIMIIAEKNGFIKTFFYYFREYMYYLINEKDIKYPREFYNRYCRERIECKAYIFLAIKNYLNKQAYSIYRDYLIFNLIADDFIDFKVDSDNMILTTVTSLLGFPEEKDELLSVNYKKMMDISKDLEKSGSATITQINNEFISYFLAKNIYDNVRKELLKNDWNY